MLTHDFIHFTLESEAELDQSSFGLLARGHLYDELAMPASEEAAQTEGVVGVLQSDPQGGDQRRVFRERLPHILRGDRIAAAALAYARRDRSHRGALSRT